MESKEVPMPTIQEQKGAARGIVMNLLKLRFKHMTREQLLTFAVDIASTAVCPRMTLSELKSWGADLAKRDEFGRSIQKAM